MRLRGAASPARIWMGFKGGDPLDLDALGRLERLAQDYAALLAGEVSQSERFLRLQRLEQAAELIDAGVELYELKPKIKLAPTRGRKKILAGSSRTSLHAKAYMVDGRRLFVGSLNLDPRSIRLNTEMGIMVDSDAMCASLRERFNERLLDVAYRVTVQNGSLQWSTRDDGELISQQAEPEMGPLQHIGQHLLRLLPVEEQL